MLPESVVHAVARELGLRPEEVRAIVRSRVPRDRWPGTIRRLADACSWTYNEALLNVDRVRHRLVEAGLLDDLRTMQDLRYGPPAGSFQAVGRVTSATLDQGGRPDERVSVRLRGVPFRFFYPAGAPGYSQVKEALLAGGDVRVWSHSDQPLHASSRVPIRQLEKDGRVLIWYADSAPYFDPGKT